MSIVDVATFKTYIRELSDDLDDAFQMALDSASAEAIHYLGFDPVDSNGSAEPDIAMAVFREYNPASLFRERMRRAGFANIGEYKTAGGQVPPFTTQVVSDEEAAAQAQAGNIVPVGGG